ncbi:hypothetical protein ONZ51_g10450 [Trametes cubensis]|uniref:DUF6533 domain-containing protein n=1 Tax=Trametes cubensis TaxID=1111947 RepID=A0AAD7TLB1_9APHY|nr:hypothetical protein ONZ51_g10450 [Trametes cubensis]
MSSGLSPAEWISTVSAGITANWVTVGPIALLVYEYVITFGQEVRYVWAQKKTGAAMLFLMIRYASLVTWCGIEAATYMLSLSDQRSVAVCITGVDRIADLRGLPFFSALRTLALSDMNRALAIVTFVLACGPVIINLWVYIAIGIFGTNIPVIGCIAQSNETAHEALIANSTCVTISRVSDIVSELIVLAVTWWHAAKGGLTWSMPGCRSSLMRAMVLHGTVYFLALVILNSLHLALTLLAEDLITGQAISLIPIFTEPLTVIIICRFLLALQRANVKSTGLETTDSELGGSGGDQYGSGTLHFASAVIGSVGGAIDAGVDVDDDNSELTFGYVDEYEDLGSTPSPEFAKPEGDSGISMV